MRLDKLLAHSGYGTRKQVKKLISSGAIQVNGQTAKKAGLEVNPRKDEVTYLNEPVHYQKYYYIMLNKPAGIISATQDYEYETVIDWVELDYHHVDLFPVGRLDIDTTGLLLLTNHGQLAHQLLSPRKEVPKVYQATIRGIVTQEDIDRFAQGLDLGDFTSKPAKLEILAVDEPTRKSEIQVEIMEGKFHQVKRMFEAVGKEVMTLTRLSMGPLHLDDQLEEGAYRELTEEEMSSLEPYGLEYE